MNRSEFAGELGHLLTPVVATSDALKRRFRSLKTVRFECDWEADVMVLTVNAPETDFYVLYLFGGREFAKAAAEAIEKDEIGKSSSSGEVGYWGGRNTPLRKTSRNRPNRYRFHQLARPSLSF